MYYKQDNVLKRLWLFLLLNVLFKYYEKESQVSHNSYRVGYQNTRK